MASNSYSVARQMSAWAEVIYHVPVGTVVVTDHQGSRLVTLTGHVDAHAALAVKQALGRLIEAGGADIQVDMAQVTGLGVLGAGVLLTAWQRARPRGMRLIVQCPNPIVAEVLRRLQLDSVLLQAEPVTV